MLQSESPSHHSYHPGPQEYVEAVEEEDLSQEAYYPTPSPRTTKGSPTQGSNKHAPYAPGNHSYSINSIIYTNINLFYLLWLIDGI